MENNGNTREVTAGTSTNAMMGPNECLLCPRSCTTMDGVKALGSFGRSSSEALSEHEGTSSASDAQMWTEFILRKLLNLSKEDCQELFEVDGAGGYPAILICGHCVQFVQRFQKRHAQLVEIEKEMDLMRAQAQGRLLGLKHGPNNRLKNVDLSGTVREPILMYCQEACNVETTSNRSRSPPPPVQASERPTAGVSLETEARSDAEGPVGEESGNSNQIEAATALERASNESSDSSLAGEDMGAAPRSEIDFGPASAVDLPVEDESDNESEIGEEPLASCSSSSKRTLEKEKVRKAKIPNKEEEGDSGSGSTQRDSGPARRKSFQRRGRLNQSIRSHDQNKSHACLFCGKGHSSHSDLIDHTRVHTQEKPFSCKVCSKEFSRSSHLSRHVRIHTNHKPYECELCSKKFLRSYSLTTHMRVHTKQKPFKCTHCNKSFSQSCNLKTHVRSVKACKKLR